MSTERSCSVRPMPSQVAHGDSTTRPRPSQRGHAPVRTNCPKTLCETCWTRPAPLQTSHVTGTVPGAAPLPPQVSQVWATRVGDADRDPAVRLCEADLGARDDVAAARRPTAPCLLAEERLAEEGAEDVGEVAEVEVRRRVPTAAEALSPVAVVGRAALRIGEHLVRLGRLAEPLLGVALLRNVGMELARELAERLLDVGIRGAAVDAENLVVVALGRRHQGVEGTGTDGRDCRSEGP